MVGTGPSWLSQTEIIESMGWIYDPSMYKIMSSQLVLVCTTQYRLGQRTRLSGTHQYQPGCMKKKGPNLNLISLFGRKRWKREERPQIMGTINPIQIAANINSSTMNSIIGLETTPISQLRSKQTLYASKQSLVIKII